MNVSLINDVKNIFYSNESDFKNENFYIYSEKAILCKSAIKENIELTSLEELLGFFISSKDTLTITITSNDSITINTDNIVALRDRVDEYNGLFDLLEEDDEISFEFKITKKKNVFNIYDVNTFFDYINGLNLEDLLSKIKEINFSVLEKASVWHHISTLKIGSMLCHSAYPEMNVDGNVLEDDSFRSMKIEKRDKSGHFANANEFNFIPEDFYNDRLNDEKEIFKILSGLYNVFLIVFLSDFSLIKGDKLTYRLKGYKLISKDVLFNDLKGKDLIELAEIYNWVYLDGNYTDKIGLARNIISIHLENDSILSAESGTSDSVKSGYDLYLKENVKQYIEIKNKINDFLYSQSDKSLELTKGVFSTIKTGVWGFITFFISIFLLRVINGKSLDGAVNIDVLVVSIILVLVATAYFGLAIYEITVDRDRLVEKYKEVRDRYKDLLDESDLNRIINVDAIAIKETKYIDGRKIHYIYLWSVICALVISSVLVLYYMNEVKTDKSVVDKTEKPIVDKTAKPLDIKITIKCEPKESIICKSKVERFDDYPVIEVQYNGNPIKSAPLREEAMPNS